MARDVTELESCALTVTNTSFAANLREQDTAVYLCELLQDDLLLCEGRMGPASDEPPSL